MIKLPEWTKNIETSHTHNSKEIWQKIQAYAHAIWKRITNWKNYPLDYINLHECQGIYTLYHFKSDLLVYTQSFSFEDPCWKEYIGRNPNAPIYFIIQGQDCEFRTLPTSQIHAWDRFFLFNQIKVNEFNPDDLVSRYRLKSSTEKADIVVSIRSNQQFLQVFKILSSFPNSVGGILSWDLEQATIMKKYGSIITTLRAWIVTIIPIDAKNFTILILHQDKILLQRIISAKNRDDLEKEICSTLRFLQRQGYKDGQAVSILAPEEKNIDEFSNTAFELINIPKKLLERENYKPKKSFLNFTPQTLCQGKLAHQFPKLCIKFLLPLSLIFLILWASVQIKSFFQDYENKWLKNKHENIHNKIPKNLEEQAHLSKLFPLYLDSSEKNPFKFINSIHKLFKGKTQISLLSWNSSEKNQTLRLKLSPTTQKLHELKKHISNNVKHIFKDATLVWEEKGKDIILQIKLLEKSHDN